MLVAQGVSQSPQACSSAGPSLQPFTWAATPYSLHTEQRLAGSPGTPGSFSAAAAPVTPMRDGAPAPTSFAVSPALQVPNIACIP